MTQYCPFCTSARAEDRVLKEGKYAYVIFSNPRLMPGHLLVIPKRHVEGRLRELSQEERDEIFDFLIEFQVKILEKLARGCDVRQNYKPYVENNRTHVDHMHFHLLPRGLDDELHGAENHKPLYRDLPEEEKTRLTSLLVQTS